MTNLPSDSTSNQDATHLSRMVRRTIANLHEVAESEIRPIDGEVIERFQKEVNLGLMTASVELFISAVALVLNAHYDYLLFKSDSHSSDLTDITSSTSEGLILSDLKDFDKALKSFIDVDKQAIEGNE